MGWGEPQGRRDGTEVIEPPSPAPHLSHLHVDVRARRLSLALGGHGRMVDEAIVDLLRDIDDALVVIYGEPKHAHWDTRQHHSEKPRPCGFCGQTADARIHLTDAGIRIEV